MEDAVINRLKRKALSNELVVAVGDSLNDPKASLKYIASKIIDKYDLGFAFKNDFEVFVNWNKIIDKAEEKEGRENLIRFVRNLTGDIKITTIHKKIASLPISNFIDLSINRSLLKALTDTGKTPRMHDFNAQQIGIWQQNNPSEPNIFFCFVDLDTHSSWFGLHEQILIHEQNRIQIENMMEMVSDKDLLLLDFSSYEAEWMLHLNYLVSPSAKIVNTRDINNDATYWSRRGVIISDVAVENLLDILLPYSGSDYTFWDKFITNRKLIDVTRDKEYDSFISYFSGDKAFAKRLENDLQLRGLHIWRDDNEIEIGDSFSDKIQEGLKNSYTFMVVLSEEALTRPWVKEELRAAYSLRLAKELKIFPILHKDCEIPPFLSDYKYADFRENKRYAEQVSLLENSIKNAVKRLRKKK